MRSPFCTCVFIGCVLLSGCGRAIYDVSGKVTYKDGPVPAGEIYFDPDAAKKNDGPQGYATIVNGEYNTAKDGKGIIGGAYVVRIQGYDGRPLQEMPLGKPLFRTHSEPVDFPKATTTKDFAVPELETSAEK